MEKSNLPSASSISFRETLALFLFALAAYSLTALQYQLFWDDHTYLAIGPEKLTRYFQSTSGIWRVFAWFWGGELLRVSHSLAVLMGVLLHAVNGWILLRILRQLACPRAESLLAAALFLTLPWYHEAIAWAAASFCYLPSTTAFLVALTLSLQWTRQRSQAPILFSALTVITLIGNLFSEQLAFAFMALPVLVMLWQQGFPRHLADFWKSRPLFGATFGSLIYLFLFAVTSNSNSGKTIQINPSTLLSAFYYQYTNLTAYVPWAHLDLLGQLSLANTLGASFLTAVALSLLAGLLLLWRMSETPSEPVKLASSRSATLLAGLLLLISIVAVFAVGGGYSLDSRKRYDIVLGAVLFLMPVLAQRRVTFSQSRKVRIALVIILIVNVATTNLLSAIYKTEFIRSRQLITSPEVTRGNRVYHLEPYIGRESLWRSIRPYWEGFYLDILLPPALKGPTTAPRAYFDLKQDRWIFEE
ncbi:MAG: hypothetical protein B9S32_08380 [Verrucomicrobia bacterium Tous-C9LFEB]|nr:MAG: hypothetical protein B9S32_08380 [Verrucomicrobia bacterium Tous-C9LFEB]